MRFRSNIVLEPDPFPKSPFPKSPLPRSVAQTLPDYAPGFCWSIFGQSLHTHRIVAFSRSCSRNSWRLRDYKAACRDAAHIRHDTFVARLRPRSRGIDPAMAAAFDARPFAGETGGKADACSCGTTTRMPRAARQRSKPITVASDVLLAGANDRIYAWRAKPAHRTPW